MEFQKFWKERARMCKQYEDCWLSCFGEACPIAKLDSHRIACSEIIKRHPVEAEQIVEQWAKEHPIVTNGKKFMEIFGKHAFCQSGFQFTIHTPDMGNTFKTFGDWLKQEYQPPKGEEG